MRKVLGLLVGLGSAAALARPINTPTHYDLPNCDEVYAYCLTIHGRSECDKLASDAKQRGSWRIEVEREGYPEADMFTVSIEKKAGAADTYIETRQFGCHGRY